MTRGIKCVSCHFLWKVKPTLPHCLRGDWWHVVVRWHAVNKSQTLFNTRPQLNVKPSVSNSLLTTQVIHQNFQRWMSWLLYRWRTQRNAISNANCRTQWIIKSLNASCASGTSWEHACLSVGLSFLNHYLFVDGWGWLDLVTLCMKSSMIWSSQEEVVFRLEWVSTALD